MDNCDNQPQAVWQPAPQWGWLSQKKSEKEKAAKSKIMVHWQCYVCHFKGNIWNYFSLWLEPRDCKNAPCTGKNVKSVTTSPGLPYSFCDENMLLLLLFKILFTPKTQFDIEMTFSEIRYNFIESRKVLKIKHFSIFSKTSHSLEISINLISSMVLKAFHIQNYRFEDENISAISSLAL